MKGPRHWQQAFLLSSPHRLSDIADAFGASSPRLQANRSWNGIIRADADGGPLFLKVINEQSNWRPITRDDLTARLRLIVQLGELGCLRVLPPAFSIEASVQHVAGCWVVAYPWRDDLATATLAEVGPQTHQVIRQSATLLAELHELLRRTQAPGITSAPPAPYGLSPDEWLRRAPQLFSRALRACDERLADSQTLALLHDAERIAGHLSERYPWFFASDADSQSIIHGDFRPGNLARPVGSDTLVLDFDLSSRSRRSVDVTLAALSHSGCAWLLGERDWAAFETFLQAYNTATHERLSAVEIRVATAFCLLRALSLAFKPVQVVHRWALLSSWLRTERPQ